MTLLKFLQLQEVEPENATSELDYFDNDRITLEESIDGEALDRSWGDILKDSGHGE